MGVALGCRGDPLAVRRKLEFIDLEVAMCDSTSLGCVRPG